MQQRGIRAIFNFLKYLPNLKILTLIFVIIFSLSVLAVSISKINKSLKTSPLDKVELPEVIIPTDKNAEEEAPVLSPSLELKVLSATLVGLWREDKKNEKELVGIRILGEVRNTGNQVVLEPAPIFKLFDKEKNLIANKRAEWTQPYKFQPLPPGEETLFDTYLNISPKSFDSIEVSFNTTHAAEELPPEIESLKIIDRKMEQKVASAEETSNNINYFQFSAKLKNTGDTDISDLAVQVWVKDSENNILAADYANYPQDILTPGQEIPILRNLLPLRTGEMKDYKVKVSGEKLD